jgi:hypothetical protein
MPSQAFRQLDLLESLPTKTDLWVDRLSAAFADTKLQSGFSSLAEDALEECAGAPIILLLAAAAAVLDFQPERALALLARFSKQAKSPAEHVLKAVALVQVNKVAAAKALLARHGLVTWSAILRAFQLAASVYHGWCSNLMASWIVRCLAPSALRQNRPEAQRPA